MNRIAYFDNARAILIFLVIIGHMMSKLVQDDQLIASMYVFIYTFHMPAFILISGYFSKKIHQQGYIAKLVKKLLIPYAVFQVIYTLYYSLLFEDNISFSFFIPRWGLWFLLSLLLWNILLYFFSRIKYGLPLAIIVSLLIGYDAHVSEFLSLSRTFFFFPFFMMGYYLKKEHFLTLKSRTHIIIGYLLAIFTFVIIYCFVPVEARLWLLGKRSFAEIANLPLELAWLARLCTYLVMTIATYMFLTIVPKRQLFFTSIGNVTITIYLLHMAVIRIFYDSPVHQYIAETNYYWIIFIIAFFIVYLLSRKLVVQFVHKITLGNK